MPRRLTTLLGLLALGAIVNTAVAVIFVYYPHHRRTVSYVAMPFGPSSMLAGNADVSRGFGRHEFQINYSARVSGAFRHIDDLNEVIPQWARQHIERHDSALEAGEFARMWATGWPALSMSTSVVREWVLQGKYRMLTSTLTTA